MTKNEAIARTLDVACLTEDRAPDEQRAMLDVALMLDMELGSFESLNKALQRPRYVRRVVRSYEPSAGRRVRLTGKQLEQFQRLEERWSLCPSCNWPMGAHYGDDKHPTNPGDLERLRAARTADIAAGLEEAVPEKPKRKAKAK